MFSHITTGNFLPAFLATLLVVTQKKEEESMSMITILGMGIAILSIIAILTSGLYDKQSKSGKKDMTKWDVVKTGFFKVTSPLSITLLKVFCVALLLSFVIRPELGDVMPAYRYSGDNYNLIYSSELDIDSISSEIQNKMTIDPEGALYDQAFLYWRTNNGDLAIKTLQQCLLYDKNWEYAYDLGVVYCSEVNYANALKYFKLALQYDPPIDSRGLVNDMIRLIENYYFNWIQSLLDR